MSRGAVIASQKLANTQGVNYEQDPTSFLLLHDRNGYRLDYRAHHYPLNNGGLMATPISTKLNYPALYGTTQLPAKKKAKKKPKKKPKK